MRLLLYLVILLTAEISTLFSESFSWPQWRGPNRNGKELGKLTLNLAWEKQPPEVLWQSPPLPSQSDGGFGSIISDGIYAYLSIVWHRDIPSEERTINDLVLRQLGVRKINLSKEIIRKAESDRASLNPRLRGGKLEEWIENWLLENLTQSERMIQGSLLASRFRKGKLAIPVPVIEKLFQIKGKVFANQEELDGWINEQDFDFRIKELVRKAVPPTKRVAEDVVVALDLRNGEMVWKTSLPGIPTGRNSSSTPCIAEGKVFAVGGKRIFCLDAEVGELLWENEIHQHGVASSPLFYDGKVYVLAGNLRAYEANSGELIWENDEVKGKAGSPILWKSKFAKLLVCNSNKKVCAVDPQSGKTVWAGSGGGNSTPVVEGNYLVVHGKPKEVGIIAYQMKKNSIVEIWRFPKHTRRCDSSPIIYDGKVFLIGSGMRLCIDLFTGETLRKIPSKHDISSPVLVKDTILAFETSGSFLRAFDASAENLHLGEKFKVNALKCASPTPVGSQLLIRRAEHLISLDINN